ncbi:hypothetical protein ACQ859_03355 [Roseateles chitinivorans]|uniref:hypothetical protein n=1 Tax=Roseateles chitinivorans TaxID=2917965 RepID=UPI00261A12A4|nr:hypothetical protein [uncultured Roseateles sp.]
MTRSPCFLRRLLLAALVSFTLTAVAAPGAHGPNGEHLDAPASGPLAGSTAPRLEAKSEIFELVGHLAGGEFSMLIDRFDTNEPVLKADVEIESGARKAKATFHADLGDYAVDDAEMLKLLATPGEHPIVITILAGKDNDLMDGVLRVGTTATAGAETHDHAGGHGDAAGHGHGGWWRWLVVAVVLAAAGLGWRWRHRTSGDALSRRLDGGQA